MNSSICSHRKESPTCCSAPSYPKLSSLFRFYIYGIHGYVIEVMFTATWDFVVNVNWKFPGYTSVWSFFIYAISGFVIERMYLQLKDRTHILLRGLIYLLWSYSWEFSTGYVLSYFNSCPWDYTLFNFNVVGLITLEYAPLWYMATLVHEQVITKCALSLCWGPNDTHSQKLLLDPSSTNLSCNSCKRHAAVTPHDNKEYTNGQHQSMQENNHDSLADNRKHKAN